MDQASLYYPVLISLLPTLLVIFFLRHKSKTNQRLPPGPWRFPIIGNLHQVLGPLPYCTMRNLLRQYGPVMFLQLGEIPTVVVSSPDAAKEIMKTHDITFASRPISTTLHVLTDHGKGAIFPPYGEYWRQVRKICILELLSHKRVQSFVPIRKEEVGNLIQSIESASLQNKPVNLTERLAVMVNDITIRTVIGGKSKVQDSYLDAVRKVSELGAGFNLVDMFPSSRVVRWLSSSVAKAKSYKKNMSRSLDDVIRQHREKKACQRDGEVKDLLDVLLRIHEEGTMQVPLDIENIKVVITVRSRDLHYCIHNKFQLCTVVKLANNKRIVWYYEIDQFQTRIHNLGGSDRFL